jgi:hypothetical protein
MTIKKYEFPTKEAALAELNATSEQVGFLQIEGAENAVDLGHITLTDAVYDGEVIVTPAVLSKGYCVDVMWTIAPPADLTKYEVFPKASKHVFSES